MKQEFFHNVVNESSKEKRARRLSLIAEMKKMTDDIMILNCLLRASDLAKGIFGKSETSLAAQAKYKKSAPHREKQMLYLTTAQKSTSTARNKFQRWTDAETEMLMFSREPDLNIAKNIGRTLYAVRTKRKKLYKQMTNFVVESDSVNIRGTP